MNHQQLEFFRQFVARLSNHHLEQLHALVAHVNNRDAMPHECYELLRHTLEQRELRHLKVGAFVDAGTAYTYASVKQREGQPYPDFVWALVEDDGFFFSDAEEEIWEQNA